MTERAEARRGVDQQTNLTEEHSALYFTHALRYPGLYAVCRLRSFLCWFISSSPKPAHNGDIHKVTLSPSTLANSMSSAESKSCADATSIIPPNGDHKATMIFLHDLLTCLSLVKSHCQCGTRSSETSWGAWCRAWRDEGPDCVAKTGDNFIDSAFCIP